MKPVYFPFTFIDNRTARRAAILWRGIRVYLPSAMPLPETMGALAGDGVIEPYQPVEADSEAVEAIYKAYCQWKAATRGAEFSFLKMPEGGGIPFFDEAAVSYLRDTIVRYQKEATDVSARLSEKSLDNGLPPDMAARVFLRITADHDAQERAVSETIDSLADREQAMFDALKGDNDGLFKKGRTVDPADTRDDPGSLMTGARIRSWARLAAHDRDHAGIFLTGSRSVLDYVIDRLDPRNRGRLVSIGDRIPNDGQIRPDETGVAGWGRSFAACMERLCNAADIDAVVKEIPSPPQCETDAQSMSLAVCVLADTPLPEFLSNCSGETVLENIPPAQNVAKHIVIICLT